MTTLEPRRSLVEERAPAISPITRWQRRAVLARLNSLRDGHLTIRDRLGETSLGHVSRDQQFRATVEVHNTRFYRSIVADGGLGAAEAYLAGDWSCDDLVTLLRIIARHQESIARSPSLAGWIGDRARRLMHALRTNSRRGSRRNIAAHYDLGNDFFSLFLDDTMTYSCGIFERPENSLADASLAKIDLACRKLELLPTDHLLEIGGGWGSLAMHAAGEYGCRVTTTTISNAQHELVRRRVAAAGLADRVTVLRSDYRDLVGLFPAAAFDKLVSIEMIEAVGHRYFDAYFAACRRLLKPWGMMLLQAITIPDNRFEGYKKSVDFIQRYIFPGGFLPSIAALCAAMARQTDWRLSHLEDFGPHYARTLAEWRRRFLDNRASIGGLRQPDGAPRYDERFLRMWEFYLCYCEAGFLERTCDVVQMLFTGPRCQRPCPAPWLPRVVSAPPAHGSTKCHSPASLHL